MTWSHKISDSNKQLKDLLIMIETQDVQNKHELNQEVCRWTKGPTSKMEYRTGCIHIMMIDGGPITHGYRYCPYCGRKIEEVVE